MPLWMFMALLVPFTLGIVNVIDKLVVERYAPSIYFYAFWIGLLEVPIGGLLLLALSLDHVDGSAIAAGLLLGGVRCASLLLLLTALRHGQLARVAPVYYLNPMMVAPMSAWFLDEELSAIIWGAIVLSVLGAGLVTWQGRGAGGAWSQPRAQMYALLAALLFAISNVIASRILEDEPFWHVFAASRVGIGLAMMLAALCTQDVRRRAWGMYRNTRFIGLVVSSEAVVSGAIGLSLGALSLGPVSQVTAIGALQPAVILAYSMALVRMAPATFPGWVSTSNIPTQLAGIAAITAAVVAISVGQ